MAATVSVWGKPGAWALDSEENESQLKQQSVNDDTQSKGSGGGAAAALSDFPSLATAAAAKTKKKKPQTLSLQEFSTYGSAKQVQSVGLTPDEMVSLPTGPRERTAEELDRSRLGGGFKSYGSSYDRPARGSSDESGRRGGFGRDSSREFTPSRADETDDWGASKKFTPGNGFERRERGERGGFFSDSNSRADGSDNWAANKSFVPSEGRRIERRVGFESSGGGADSDNWTKRKEDEGRKFGAFDSLREKRMNNVSEPEAWGRKRDDSNGRPRLNLQPRTIPIGEGQQNDNGTTGKPKGSNPFGQARPREEILKEKGQDWKEIDHKLESLKMKEAGKKSSGSSKEGASPEKRTERSWRRFDMNADTHSRAENTVNGSSEEAGAGECKSYAEACQREN
ncbi:PREDICTED: eukaryotic translation initiation factor 4B3-like [Ipomoea nil]|uniref:eukaryotic translation initiation factor 4B3-like n=1 Tax=Ipomoea nil TaxID=35883 RepID=UPI000900F293|nr:PREDICTED: eukaryotic translation initiation factor 4B3-like [Ipomoea nil]